MLPVLLTAACAIETGHLVCKTETQAGKAVTLTFAASGVGADPNQAFEGRLCSTPAKSLTLAKLWMTEHGHGSARTRLAADGDCTKITRMVFTMSGDWELRLTFADNDSGVIHVPVP